MTRERRCAVRIWRGIAQDLRERARGNGLDFPVRFAKYDVWKHKLEGMHGASARWQNLCWLCHYCKECRFCPLALAADSCNLLHSPYEYATDDNMPLGIRAECADIIADVLEGRESSLVTEGWRRIMAGAEEER